jgi:serine/threonine-protein kinase
MDIKRGEPSITPEDFRRLREIFESALELPAGERKAFIAGACEGNAEMIRELELMLAAEHETGGLLDGPAASTRPGFCPSCKSKITATDRFCRFCGTPAAAEHTEEGRFRPGALFAKRFRIVGLLGRGGMGEVYRANDLELGQPVALKFLSSFRFDQRARNRLRNEVKLARQISHPNVCRVYDLGEAEGELYLSMEYVDGEDLAALLKRIGRLPADKGVQIARKLCAGLAAAHARGVLHRDLKPANIMIDAAGEVRIMDFGLAAAVEQIGGSEARSGTPAYMAPEQLAGREASVQSDVYALGLVLYEIFTGKAPFQAKSLEELLQLKESSNPANPSTWVPDLEPAVERAILRSLDPNPKHRPASALAFAAALPGGDPLAEALAAGETPSPEMVAASGSTEALRPATAITLLAIIALQLMALCWAAPKIYLVSQLPLENSPDVLTAKAREIVRSLGYTEPPADFVSGFKVKGVEIPPGGLRDLPTGPYIEYMAREVTGTGRARIHQWKAAVSKPPSMMYYWYRESPEPIVSSELVTLESPAPTLSGDVSVVVGLDGRLLQFAAVPPQVDSPDDQHVTPDWAALFTAAHLDIRQFQSVEPQWTPLAATDSRVAWTGSYPGSPDLMVRVEAAAFHGKVDYFEVVFPWTRSTRMPGNDLVTPQWEHNPIVIFLTALLALAAVLLARHNLKAGRGDLRGAFRLAAVYFGASVLVDVLLKKSLLVNSAVFGPAIALDVCYTMTAWTIYIAIEPWVRRYWPKALITWSRVFVGRWRDPLVGRDILAGVIWGLVVSSLLPVGQFIAVTTGGLPAAFFPRGFEGSANAAGWLTNFFRNGLLMGPAFFLMLCLLRVLLRKEWLAAAVFVVLWEVAAFGTFPGDPTHIVIGVVGMFIMASGMVLLLTRFGLLSAVVTVHATVMVHMFFTTDFSAWYGQSSMLTIAAISAVALFGFKLSLGPQPVWRGNG